MYAISIENASWTVRDSVAYCPTFIIRPFEPPAWPKVLLETVPDTLRAPGVARNVACETVPDTFQASSVSRSAACGVTSQKQVGHYATESRSVQLLSSDTFQASGVARNNTRPMKSPFGPGFASDLYRKSATESGKRVKVRRKNSISKHLRWNLYTKSTTEGHFSAKVPKFHVALPQDSTKKGSSCGNITAQQEAPKSDKLWKRVALGNGAAAIGLGVAGFFAGEGAARYNLRDL